MAVNFKLIDYTVKVLVEKLMAKYQSNYDSALELVLNSKLYARLLTDTFLLEEGDIYLFNLLDKELSDNQM